MGRARTRRALERDDDGVDRPEAFRAGVRKRVPCKRLEPQANSRRRAGEVQDGIVEDEGVGHKADRAVDTVRRRAAHLQVQDVA